MKVYNHLDFARFDYDSGTSTLFALGDVVLKKADPDYNSDGDEIGVIIQVHSEFEYRTDMFGNCCNSEIRIATLDEIEKYRPELLNDMILV
jgi:hypothetical protein